ncbi:MAG TPA: selenocysteine-specific translation elongation factor [Spirochaetota bacterium]|nr:selenocysteine-specific translation elongation factor [Spirochaetota bacterium]
MYVIGTAGHVDHGKTSLIKALTGIDADRLPEEKQRHMTIDIGFAYITLPTVGTVSIVDVPGHERFIRNMVTGAWGIDIGLLVIAADDGWMKQTDDHVKVLSILGIPAMVVALTKVDSIEQQTLPQVLSNIDAMLATTPYGQAPVIPCSSVTGEGITALKEALTNAIIKLPAPTTGNKPYLHIDRVFTVKGAGTVVTGTSKNGSFALNDTITIVPHAMKARIRQIQSHNTQQQQTDVSQRTALALAGVEKTTLQRGDIIVRENFFTSTTSCIAYITHTFTQIKNNQWIEVLIGTASYDAQYTMLSDSKPIVRLKCKQAVWLYPSQRFVATLPGGHAIIAGGYILCHTYSALIKKNPIANAITNNNSIEANAILCIVACNPFITCHALKKLFPDESAVTKAIQLLAQQSVLMLIDDIVLTQSQYDTTVKLLQQYAGTDTTTGDLSQKLSVPHNLVNHIMAKYDYGKKPTGELSDAEKHLLQQLLQRGIEGINPKDFPAHRHIIDTLIKTENVIVIDRELLWHKDVFLHYAEGIMEHFNTNKELTVQQAKEITGLSRKYVIPLLNALEQKKFIKRYGDIRLKV